MRDDHPELCRDHVEPSRGLFADDMHRCAATWTVRIFRLDRHVYMRQMGGERTAICATFVGTPLCRHRILLVVGGLVTGDGLLDIFESQQQLLAIELLRAPAELRSLQLTQKMSQTIVLRQRLVAFRNRSITLSARRCDKRLQHFDVGGKLRSDLAHARHSIRFASPCGLRRAA
jgi:hypothetical protein